MRLTHVNREWYRLSDLTDMYMDVDMHQAVGEDDQAVILCYLIHGNQKVEAMSLSEGKRDTSGKIRRSGQTCEDDGNSMALYSHRVL